MNTKNILAIVIMGFLAGMSRADDIVDLVSSQRKVFESFPGRSQVTLERQEAWHLAGVCLHFGEVTDADIARLSRFVTLKTLRLPASSSLISVKGIEQLGAFRRLRKLVLPWNLSKGVIDAIPNLAELEDLELGVKKNAEVESLSHLKGFPSLKRLKVWGIDNTLVASIASISGLEELTLLDVTDAGVAQMAGLRRLHTLKAGYVGATGVAALGNLPCLKELHASFDHTLNGNAGLSALRHLKSLNIRGVSDHQSGLVRLPEGLRWLGVNDSALTRLDFHSCERIESLEIRVSEDVEKRNEDVKWLRTATKLRELVWIGLSGDREVEAIAKHIPLRALALVDQKQHMWPTQLSDEGMRAIGSLRSLNSLEFRTSAVTDAGMEALRNLKELRRLDIGGLSGVSEQGLVNIWRLKGLRSLVLDLGLEPQRPIDDLLDRLATLTELEELRVPGRITDDGLLKLSCLKKLRQLDLTGNSGYTDAGVASLMKVLPELRTVKLSYHPLNGKN